MVRESIEDLEELPREEKSRRSTQTYGRTGKSAYFRRKSCKLKRRFHSDEEAKDFIKGAAKAIARGNPNREINELRAYKCPICNGFHTTKVLREEQEREQDPEGQEEDNVSAIKQVIVVRKDLKMRTGKAIAQACHASIAFLTRQLQGQVPEGYFRSPLQVKMSPVQCEWINSSFAKICVYVDSEQELLDVESRAKEAGLECHLVVDSGLTEFGGVATRTCLAIGPDFSEKIDPITGMLPLL